MLRITLFFCFFLVLAPSAFGKQPLTVSQSYHSKIPNGCRYDFLLPLPEGVSQKDISSATATLETKHWNRTSYEYEQLSFTSGPIQYRESLDGVSVSFSSPTAEDCYLFTGDATVSLQVEESRFTNSYFSTNTPYCGSSRCEGDSEALWSDREEARAQYVTEEQKDKDIKDAGDRFAARLKGELALRHPTLLGVKTADTLGKYGVRYEPIGFFTLGLTERVDLGLGVRSYRAGVEKLFFPGVEAKVKLVEEGKIIPALAISASGNTLLKDRQLPQGDGGLRLGASALGSFSEEAQSVGDTQFTVGLHASKDMGSLEGVAGEPNARLHLGALYTQTQAAKGTELGAESFTGEDVLLQVGVDFTERHNILALLAEANYSLARQRTDISAGFRFSLVGSTADLGVGFTGAESLVVDGVSIELPARFYPRIGFSFLF